jgi:putative DNA primase/helicase
MVDDLDEDEPSGPRKRTVKRTDQDDEQAEWLDKAFGYGIRFDHTQKQWHIWNGVRWAPDKTRRVQRMVMDSARERLYAVAGDAKFSKSERDRLESMYRKLLDINPADRALLALSTREGYGTDGADWDQDPKLLGCANGIVDLTRNALVENPGPELLVTHSTGHDFVPIASWDEAQVRAPRFMQFLGEITGEDWQLASFYLLWFGYSLFGHTEEQRFLMLTGLGRNGKGALVTAMREVFGEYSANADQNLYMRSRHGSARSDGARADLMALKGKRLAAMSEPDGGSFNEEMLKAHTGGDPIVARSLYSNHVISWAPTHSIVFLTNEPPAVTDIGPAMSARVMVADFRERFDGPREDKKLYDKLKREAPGILAILCFCAKLWHESPAGLALPDRITKASAEYLSSNDPLGRALTEAFVVEKGVTTAARVLYDAYCDWHAQSDEEGDPISLTGFGLTLAKRGFQKGRTSSGISYRNIRPRGAMEFADGGE